MSNLVLKAEHIKKSYFEGPQSLEILKNIHLNIQKGERIAIIGASGSGKSTLLNILGGLDIPDAGEVFVRGQSLSKCTEQKRGVIRNQSLGFVYQFHHLLPEFTAIENVSMPQFIGKVAKSIAHDRSEYLLERVGLKERSNHKPSELSGGERQRVAIARSLANQPDCVLMDEPTGNLDKKNADAIQQLMLDLSKEHNTSFVVVTHDEKLAQNMDCIYQLTDGVLDRQ